MDSEDEVAVMRGTGSDLGPNTLSLNQRYATYAEFRAEMRRFETRYEKPETVVNMVTCGVKKCTFRVYGM